ncbi:MAG: hypothetical protein IMZ58_07575 [Thermoplasmata archaeon]|nr:hypothetical protein [Thermoplasmata archaeon]
MQQKEIKKIMTLVVIFIFVFTPFSAISAPRSQQNKVNYPVAEKIRNNQSILSSYGYNITLEGNEEIIWMADHVTNNEQIAYIVGKLETYTTEPAPEPTPLPHIEIADSGYMLTAYGVDNTTLFVMRVSGKFCAIVYSPDNASIAVIIPDFRTCHVLNYRNAYYRCFGTLSVSPHGQGTELGVIELVATVTHYHYTRPPRFLLGIPFGGTPMESYGVDIWCSINRTIRDGGGSFWLNE